MMDTLTIPQRPKRKFVQEDFELKNWDSLSSYYNNLLERKINNVTEFYDWLADYSELHSVIGEEMRWRYVKTSVDTTDTIAQENLQYFYKEIDPKLKLVSNQIQNIINESPFKAEIAADTRFRNLLLGIEKDLALFTEKNIDIQKELSLKENEYAQISGGWTLEYNEKTYTFQQAVTFLKNRDRKIREEVYKKMVSTRLKDEDKLDNLFVELITKRQQVAKNAGYKNFRDYIFDAKHRFDYTPEDCADFSNSVSELVTPLVGKLQSERKTLMGVDKLFPWDLSVDKENKTPLKPFNSTEDFISKSIECLNQIDPYFGECIAIMNEMGHLDLESRQGKAPGGYNMSMPEIGVPFIFMNHANSEGDVRVMVHEAGHAVHSFLSHSLKYDFFKNIPMEAAELASMSMELFTLDYWDVFYTDEEDRKRAVKNHLEGLLGTLLGVAKGDEFQQWIYTQDDLSIEKIKGKWLQLSDKYGTGIVSFDGLESDLRSNYQRILHFYQVPFYYIEYGFAQLGAIAMYKNFKENKAETISKYKKALSLGYTTSLPDIYKAAGIQFNFSAKYVKDLLSFLNEEIERL